ncbi:MAG: 30S ribosomal protein S18 [Alphaproteobacteria bacterium]|nr:30S ribosomal protein S18 [Alphaproteobacteria bacterium]MBL0718031.1 30S ribosomal protein S18 [Alphaproteobacteria bacterium]
MVVRTAIFRKKSNSVKSDEITYKNPELLLTFLSQRGRITPSRISGVSAKMQRKLAVAIKRARFLGLIPYVRNNDLN